MNKIIILQNNNSQVIIYTKILVLENCSYDQLENMGNNNNEFFKRRL